MPRLLPGTLLLEGVSGVVEEVPGVEEHEEEVGEAGGSGLNEVLKENDPVCSPAENRGRAARESRPRTFAIFRESRPRTFAIFRESAAGLRSPLPGCSV
ncbi:unnamed protein product [Boreogadus saida]